MSASEKRIECPTCDGTGTHAENHGMGMIETLGCHDCEGTGSIPAPVAGAGSGEEETREGGLPYDAVSPNGRAMEWMVPLMDAINSRDWMTEGGHSQAHAPGRIDAVSRIHRAIRVAMRVAIECAGPPSSARVTQRAADGGPDGCPRCGGKTNPGGDYCPRCDGLDLISEPSLATPPEAREPRDSDALSAVDMADAFCAELLISRHDRRYHDALRAAEYIVRENVRRAALRVPASAPSGREGDAEYDSALKAVCEMLPGFYSPQSSEWPRQLECIKRFESAAISRALSVAAPREASAAVKALRAIGDYLSEMRADGWIAHHGPQVRSQLTRMIELAETALAATPEAR